LLGDGEPIGGAQRGPLPDSVAPGKDRQDTRCSAEPVAVPLLASTVF